MSAKPPAVGKHGQQDQQHGNGQRREYAGEDGSDIFHNLLLGLDKPGGHHEGPGHSERQDPIFQDRLEIGANAPEGRECEGDQDCAAQRQQRVVDRELAGKPDEIHAPLIGPPPPSDIGHSGQHPQDDRSVQGGEHPGGAAWGERVEVEHDRQGGKRDDQCRRHGSGEAPLPREVRGQEREDEQAQVAHQGCAVVDPGSTDLDRDARPDSECEDDGQLAPGGRVGVVGALRHQDELLPQPLGVLAGKFARDGVEVAQALDGDEESLLVIEAGRLPVGDLLAQMVLQLVDVGGGDRPVPLDITAPPVDLGLEFSVWRHHAHPSVAAAGP